MFASKAPGAETITHPALLALPRAYKKIKRTLGRIGAWPRRPARIHS
jgi:hypothetical protein